MIKAFAPNNGRDGRHLVILGLETENIRRMQAGQPIVIRADDIPGFKIEADVMIMTGENKPDIMAQLAKAGLRMDEQPPEP